MDLITHMLNKVNTTETIIYKKVNLITKQKTDRQSISSDCLSVFSIINNINNYSCSQLKNAQEGFSLAYSRYFTITVFELFKDDFLFI